LVRSQIKPYLKWAGGKRQLLPEIKKQLPGDVQSCTYYEPFVGAGALFFDLQPAEAVINDRNSQLMAAYAAIRENVEDLIALLKTYENTKERYYTIRSRDRDADFNRLTDTEKAARIIFLNKTCYNGLYRVNSRGFFNVPYGKHKNPAICEETSLRQISAYLKANRITIMTGDFEAAVSRADKRSFVYFDPPYDSRGRGFTGYQADGFGEGDQKRLRDVFAEMTRRGTKCLLSSSDTEFIRDLYNDEQWEIITVKAKRFINSDSSGRGAVHEVLIKNWKTP
jgi:DNA adenine methylase